MDSRITLVALVAPLGLLACEIHPYQTPVVYTTSAEYVTVGPTTVTTMRAGEEYADTDPRALDDFRGDLDPYGRWIEDDVWGTVWFPFVIDTGVEFRPYVTSGHWAFDDDWIWVSDYSWGAIAFHYGRWVEIAPRGWCWIPGRRYAGAWVEWRIHRDGWIGWAPLRPTWRWHERHAIAVLETAPANYAYAWRDDVFTPRLRDRLILGSRAVQLDVDAQPWTPPIRPPHEERYEHPRVGPALYDLGIDLRRAPAPQSRPALVRARELSRPQFAPQPEPHVLTPAPQPRVVAPAPQLRVTPAPQPMPRVVTPAPQPRVITPTPAPRVIAPSPSPSATTNPRLRQR